MEYRAAAVALKDLLELICQPGKVGDPQFFSPDLRRQPSRLNAGAKDLLFQGEGRTQGV